MPLDACHLGDRVVDVRLGYRKRRLAGQEDSEGFQVHSSYKLFHLATLPKPVEL